MAYSGPGGSLKWKVTPTGSEFSVSLRVSAALLPAFRGGSSRGFGWYRVSGVSLYDESAFIVLVYLTLRLISCILCICT